MSPDTKKDSVQEKLPVRNNEYKTTPQLLAGFTASLSLFCAGMSFGWPAPSLPKLQDESSDLYLTSNEGAWVVSALLMGACVGPVVSALLVNRVGRKWFLYITGIPYLLCWTLMYLSQSFKGLIAARFISGLGVGGTYATAPMYLGEISETRIRGALSTMSSLLTSAGILMAYSVGPWVDRKTLALINLIPTIAFLLTFVWMPESPYQYLRKKQVELAQKSLTWLRGTSSIDEELKEMSNLLEIEMKQQGKITELITVRSNRKATFIMWLVMSAQQSSGTIALLAYITLLFEKASLELDPRFAVIIIGFVALASNLITTCVVDKVGKKRLFLLSACGTSLCLATIATYFYLERNGVKVNVVSWIPLVAMLLFCISFSLGLGPITHAILSEIFPTTVKAWATMLVSIYGSIVALFISKIYQVVADKWGLHVILYGLCMSEITFAILIFLILPETGGKSFRQIQEMLGSESMKSNANTKC